MVIGQCVTLAAILLIMFKLPMTATYAALAMYAVMMISTAFSYADRQINKRRNDMKTTQVAAALIWQGDRFMICRRPANKGNALLWEFVGGKLEPGETHQQALIRECREELGITVEVGDEFCDVYHQYPDIYVHLVVFNAKIAEGTPQLLEHCGLEWITPQEIKTMPSARRIKTYSKNNQYTLKEVYYAACSSV